MVIIPAVAGVAAAEPFMDAVSACFTFFRNIAAEDFKAVIPDVREAVRKHIALDGFLSSFNIQAGADIAVCHDGGCVDTGVALPVPVPDFRFIVSSQPVGTAVAERISLLSFFLNEIKQTDIVFLCYFCRWFFIVLSGRF